MITREEVIEAIKEAYGNSEYTDEIIKALEQEPCEDYISRQALLKLMGEEPFNWTDSDKELQEVEDYRNFRNIVEQLPSVNPQKPKTGHWIRVDDTKMRCSNCDIIHLIAQYPRVGINYCPNCGAKMIEPQKSNDGMTSEEAKELLDNLIGMVSDNQESDYDTALKMGIKALEQEKEPILDKIRAEILEEKECAYADFEQYKVEYLGVDAEYVEDELPQDDFRYGMERAIEIINKHKAEG